MNSGAYLTNPGVVDWPVSPGNHKRVVHVIFALDSRETCLAKSKAPVIRRGAEHNDEIVAGFFAGGQPRSNQL